MEYKYIYETRDGFDDILITSDGESLLELNFINDETNIIVDKNELTKKKISSIQGAIKWLDIYFSGETPDFIPKYKIKNLTPFRKEVYDITKNIPFGKTMTYGDIGKIISENRGIEKMSNQAVGQALKNNPIIIIIPCHRVLGAKNKLVGYGGGIYNKRALLEHEGAKYEE